MPIEFFPTIPDEIKDARSKGELAVFVGAGVSRLVGCCSWKRLAKNLLNGVSAINYRGRQTLLPNMDPKRIITACQTILPPQDFQRIIEESLCLNPKMPKGFSEIFPMLRKIGNTFVTTNIDKHFDREFADIRYLKDHFKSPTLNSDTIYHIHGSVLDHNETVLTSTEYIDRYNDSDFTKFLLKLFDEKNVLFVGYGLTEFEVLDFLYSKNHSRGVFHRKHFILEGYYSDMKWKSEFDTRYYNTLGIENIGYNMDEIGYQQLFKVIEDWYDKLIVTPAIPGGYSGMKLIDSVVV